MSGSVTEAVSGGKPGAANPARGEAANPARGEAANPARGEAANPARGEAANPARGEAAVRIGGEALVLRPSFAALVAVEEELGPLFALVERAAAGELRLGELAALFWHCVRDAPQGLDRARFAEALADAGLAALTPVLRVLLRQILQGR